MKSRPGRTVMAFLSLLLVPAPDARLTAMKGVPQRMEFQDFAREMKGRGAFTMTVEGDAVVSFHTGRRYAHYETVVFFGGDDARAAHRILSHTENDVVIRQGGRAVTVGWRLMRTRMTPAVERIIERAALKHYGDEKDRMFLSLLGEEGVDSLVLEEYGLEPGRTYHAILETERYHLPPEGPGGRPRSRENTVMVISDRPFPNDLKATPLYRGWSY